MADDSKAQLRSQVETTLRGADMSDDAKARAWDTFFATTDADRFRDGMNSVTGLPNPVKLQLLKLKFPQAAQIAPQPTPHAASSGKPSASPAAPGAAAPPAPTTPPGAGNRPDPRANNGLLTPGWNGAPGSAQDKWQHGLLSQAPPGAGNRTGPRADVPGSDPSVQGLFDAFTTPLSRDFGAPSLGEKWAGQERLLTSFLPNWLKPLGRAQEGVAEAAGGAVEQVGAPLSVLMLPMGMVSEGVSALPTAARLTGSAINALAGAAGGYDSAKRIYNFFKTGSWEDLGRAAVELPLSILGLRSAWVGNPEEGAARPPVDEFAEWRDANFSKLKDGTWLRKGNTSGTSYTDERLHDMFKGTAHVEFQGAADRKPQFGRPPLGPGGPEPRRISNIGQAPRQLEAPSAQKTAIEDIARSAGPFKNQVYDWATKSLDEITRLRQQAQESFQTVQRQFSGETAPFAQNPPVSNVSQSVPKTADSQIPQGKGDFTPGGPRVLLDRARAQYEALDKLWQMKRRESGIAAPEPPARATGRPMGEALGGRRELPAPGANPAPPGAIRFDPSNLPDFRERRQLPAPTSPRRTLAENLEYAQELPQEVLAHNIHQMETAAAIHASGLVEQAGKDPAKQAAAREFIEQAMARLKLFKDAYQKKWGTALPEPQESGVTPKPEEPAPAPAPAPPGGGAPPPDKPVVSNDAHDPDPAKPTAPDPQAGADTGGVMVEHIDTQFKTAREQGFKKLLLTVTRGGGKPDLKLGINLELDTPEELAQAIRKAGGEGGMATIENQDPERPVKWKFLLGDAPAPPGGEVPAPGSPSAPVVSEKPAADQAGPPVYGYTRWRTENFRKTARGWEPLPETGYDQRGASVAYTDEAVHRMYDEHLAKRSEPAPPEGAEPDAKPAADRPPLTRLRGPGGREPNPPGEPVPSAPRGPLPPAPTDKPKPTRLRGKGDQVSREASGPRAEDEQVSAARTSGGKIKLGADVASLGKVLGSSLYSGKEAHIVTKELMQNAFDAVRHLKGQGEVKVFLDQYSNEITIEDGGKGMSPKDLATVFTDLGASGKRGSADASGGFGLAKAAPLMMSESLEVVSVADVVKGRGAERTTQRIRSTMRMTPQQLMGEGVDLREEVVSKDTPTGTRIKATMPPDSQGWYEARNFLNNSRKSINPPGKLTTRGGHDGEPVTRRMEKIKQLSIPDSAEVSIYGSSERGEGVKTGSVPLEVNNNGIYQFETSIYLGEGADLAGIPKTLAVDVKSTVEEGHPNYPFAANRESLRDVVMEKVNEYIEEEIVKPAQKKATDFIGQKYDSMPTLASRDYDIPIFDSGGRLEPHELSAITNNPDVINLGEEFTIALDQAIDRLIDNPQMEYPYDRLGHTIERGGFALSDSLHGVYIKPQGRSKATVFVNPFSFATESTPTQAAHLMWHTIKHEILHDKVAGHYESFTTGEAKVAQALGEYELDALLRLRNAYAEPGNPGQFRQGLNDALQIYKESRGRSPREDDPFNGTASRSAPPGPEGGQGQLPDVGAGRKEPVRGGERPAAAVGGAVPPGGASAR